MNIIFEKTFTFNPNSKAQLQEIRDTLGCGTCDANKRHLVRPQTSYPSGQCSFICTSEEFVSEVYTQCLVKTSQF